MELAGLRVVVVGLAASGRAAAELCAARGATVIGVDVSAKVEPIEGVTLELGPHRRETFTGADLLVVSPGVLADQPDVVAAEAAGVAVIGELGLAASLLPDLPMLGITGTNGKSTVTSFTGQILRNAGMRAFVGGNLGNPLCNAVPRSADDPVEYDVAVVECSSYQLERAGPFRPRGAVILNLTPDHLARHGTMQGYAAAKARIFRNQLPTDLALLPADDATLAAACDGVGEGSRAHIGALAGDRGPGVWRGPGGQVRIALPGVAMDLDLSGLRVPGEHNKDNAAVAAALALCAGAPAEVVQASIPALQALEHRMEIVAEIGGVQWINDSKATNVDAALVGIRGLGRRAVVLLGGQAKGPGFAELVDALRRHHAVITFGGSGDAIAAELRTAGLPPIRVRTLQDAVVHAAAIAEPGDAVLLSPGCASFDAFDNFEHRGRVFRALVQEVHP
jgi:UDP-N-acetylmuramoylalanine--D-glutamate ligase